MLPSNDGYEVSGVHVALEHNSGHGSGNKRILNPAYMQRIIIRIGLKLIFSFIIEVSTDYFRDEFIYIKLGESKVMLLN